jgi:hypothetical protein
MATVLVKTLSVNADIAGSTGHCSDRIDVMLAITVTKRSSKRLPFGGNGALSIDEPCPTPREYPHADCIVPRLEGSILQLRIVRDSDNSMEAGQTVDQTRII